MSEITSRPMPIMFIETVIQYFNNLCFSLLILKREQEYIQQSVKKLGVHIEKRLQLI